MSMQIALMQTAERLAPGQSIIIPREDMRKAAEGMLTSLLYDSVRESDVREFAQKIEESWGIVMTKAPMGGDWTMSRPAAMSFSRQRAFLQDIAREYHQRTEDYDREVCTGPIVRGVIMPADGRERSMINRHAITVREELVKRAFRAGVPREAVLQAIQDWRKSHVCLD